MQKLRASFEFKRLGLFALLALCIALPAQAQWKWRDASGKLQFSDLPPPQGTAEKDILQRPKNQQQERIVIVPYGTAASASAPPPPASAPSKTELERQAREKQQDKDAQLRQKEADAKQAEQRRDNCVRAKENMKMLQDGIRLTRQNDKGEPIVIDERQRAEEIARTRTVIDSECR
jgi:hypothetical protein